MQLSSFKLNGLPFEKISGNWGQPISNDVTDFNLCTVFGRTKEEVIDRAEWLCNVLNALTIEPIKSLS